MKNNEYMYIYIYKEFELLRIFNHGQGNDNIIYLDIIKTLTQICGVMLIIYNYHLSKKIIYNYHVFYLFIYCYHILLGIHVKA